MLQGKTVVLGVTGSIAAYKAASLASTLQKQHADVHVILTKNGAQFVAPLTFETLTGNKCYIDTFDRNFRYDVSHISLAKKADILLIAPATANIIGKLACGIADDMLTTTVLACRAPIWLAPAMNTSMYQNPIVQDNLKKLASFGYHIIPPDAGRLACGDVGVGKMPEPASILERIVFEIAYEKDLAGRRILVTAGATEEPLDPVRYLTNHSSGKMGYAVAKAATRRGAQVTLVAGFCALEPPLGVTLVQVQTAWEMFEAVAARAPEQNAVIMAAAVADFRPSDIAPEKIKKRDISSMQLSLEPTEDILTYLGQHKPPGQFLCGFSMETENLLDNSRKKLMEKNLDMICCNSLKEAGAGFGTDTNHVTLLQKDSITPLPMLSKEAVGHAILDVIAKAIR